MSRQEQYTTLARDLRSRILSGEWRPGSRLPTRLELRHRTGASPGTLQKALDLLRAESFVETRGRAGTFVADDPPLQGSVGLLFCGEQQAPDRSLYDIALERAAALLTAREDVRFRFFYGFDAGREAPEFAVAHHAVETEQLAGLILSRPFDALAGTALTQIGHFPLAGFHSWAQYPAMPRVTQQNPCAKIVARLAELRLGSFALVYGANARQDADGRISERWRAAATAAGLRLEPHLCIPVNPIVPQTARIAMALLMRTPDRPDAVVVLDDNLATNTVAGLLDTGAAAVQDLRLVVQCNFPYPPELALPCLRIGHDMLAQLRHGVALLRGWRAGRHTAAVVEVPALWERELPLTVRDPADFVASSSAATSLAPLAVPPPSATAG